MSRRPVILAAGAVLALAGGLLGQTSGAREAVPLPAPAGESEANLDWAVNTRAGAWCTVPRPVPELATLPLTIEGWFQAQATGQPAVLVEVWDAAARRPWVRLAIDGDLGLHLEPHSGPSSAALAPATAGTWTHYTVRIRPGRASLMTWDQVRGERLSAPEPAPAGGAGSGPLQVCVGGSAGGGEPFNGLVDEVRLWASELPEAEARTWRHRRVTEAHPSRPALVGYWPFRAGQGSSEADEARVGPLRARVAAWVPLPRLDYGPVLRAVDRGSARFLFHARDVTGTERDWSAALEIGTSADLAPGQSVVTPPVPVGDAEDHVAHLARNDLQPQMRYYYAPLIDGRRALDPGPGRFPSFVTLPDLGGRNADFTAAFFADQHAPSRPEPPLLRAYEAAAAARPLFWAQLGDVATGSTDGATPEHRRTRAQLQAIWERNFAPGTPQAAFAARFGLNLATISDHEIEDNFSLNWHDWPYGRAASPEAATLHDRLEQYDRSLARWWTYFGWGDRFDDRLGRVARADRGESVMAEAPAPASGEAKRSRACLDRRDGGAFRAGDFVSLADGGTDTLHTRVVASGADQGCRGGWGVTLAESPARAYEADRGATLAVGARYARAGHYRAWQPFPFVEFFVADTTSYRGDTYEKRSVYAREANRDGDHARYRWDPAAGPTFIYEDRPHGANRTTDGVRSWLGPMQRKALLDALASSTAAVVVVVAGYPLYSVKFEGSPRYWEARESGFDFAAEVEQIVSALERLDRLVLWVHGDGHTPALVRLRPNIYQLEIGATLPSSERPGHRARNLASGSRSHGDAIGGGYLIAGHQPDLNFGDDVNDVFEGGLDQFEGYLRLYCHPGQEALRSSESAGLRRGRSDREVVIPAHSDPAVGGAARHVVGKVVRLRFGDQSVHSVVTAYRYEPGEAVLTLQEAVVQADPDELRVLIDAVPWVEARWFDARGHEWRDFSFVMRKDL